MIQLAGLYFNTGLHEVLFIVLFQTLISTTSVGYELYLAYLPATKTTATTTALLLPWYSS